MISASAQVGWNKETKPPCSVTFVVMEWARFLHDGPVVLMPAATKKVDVADQSNEVDSGEMTVALPPGFFSLSPPVRIVVALLECTNCSAGDAKPVK